MNLFQDAMHLLAKKVIVRTNVDGATAEKRMATCLGCDKRDAEGNTCTVCGCFLDLKTGAATNWNGKRLRNEITHCPLGKWDDIETANIYRQMDGKELLK